MAKREDWGMAAKSLGVDYLPHSESFRAAVRGDLCGRGRRGSVQRTGAEGVGEASPSGGLWTEAWFSSQRRKEAAASLHRIMIP